MAHDWYRAHIARAIIGGTNHHSATARAWARRNGLINARPSDER
jgi:hypothetical protein